MLTSSYSAPAVVSKRKSHCCFIQVGIFPLSYNQTFCFCVATMQWGKQNNRWKRQKKNRWSQLKWLETVPVWTRLLERHHVPFCVMLFFTPHSNNTVPFRSHMRWETLCRTAWRGCRPQDLAETVAKSPNQKMHQYKSNSWATTGVFYKIKVYVASLLLLFTIENHFRLLSRKKNRKKKTSA